MSFALFAFGALVGLLLLLLVWALLDVRRDARYTPPLETLGDSGRTHVNFLPQMRRALEREDEEFLARVGLNSLRGRVIRERRRVALSYLAALRQDFDELGNTAKAIAALSPEIGVAQEFARLRLRIGFLWRYRIIWISLRLGFAPLPQISRLSNFLSGYSVRLEKAMKELGERAAMVAELASSPDRRRIHPV